MKKNLVLLIIAKEEKLAAVEMEIERLLNNGRKKMVDKRAFFRGKLMF